MRILKLCFPNVFAFACLITAAAASQPDGPGQSRTPSSNFARLEEPWQFINGVQPDAEDALNHQGYTITWHGNPDTSFYPALPDPTFDEWITDISAGAGAFFLSGDASTVSTGIEVYPHTPRGRRLANERGTYLANHGYNGEVYLYEDAFQSGWAVSHGWSSIPGHCSFGNAIVDIETCNSTSSGSWTGARVEFVNGAGLTDQESNTNTDAIWGGMDGEDDWKHRTACWAFKNASSKCSMRQPQTGGGYTTLAPCAKWTNASAYQQLSADGMTVQLLFDTHVNSSVDPCNVWSTDDGIFTLDNAAWEGDTLVSVQVHPVADAYGTGDLVADKQYVYSADCGLLYLDGDGSGGSSDWSIPLKHDNNPAAVIGSFRWDNNVLTWIVEREYQTAGYRIEGGNAPEDSWYSIGDLQPPGVGVRTVSVGDAFAKYRLVEVQTSGREIVGDIARAQARSPVEPIRERSVDELRDAFRATITAGAANGSSALLNGEKLIVFCPSAWSTDFTNLASYLNAYHGITTQVVAIEQFGAPENRYSGIKGTIVQLYGQGFRYVLLVGDASDWQYFDGTYTAEYWPSGQWEAIRQQYLSVGYPEGGNPELNVIPVLMAKDQLPPGQSISSYQPYYQLNDMLSYGDVNDDGLPDVAVGRWPITTETEALVLLNKQLQYLDQGGWGYNQPYRVAVYLGDVNHQETGDGAHATATANAIKSHFRAGTAFDQLLESQHTDTWGRIVAAANLWNQGDEIALFASSISGRSEPGNFFNIGSGFTMDMIGYGTFTPVVLAPTCGTADEYRTEYPFAPYGRPVCHRMLVADNRGAIAWIGPSAGTVQEGNRNLGERVVQYIQADPSRPVCESVRLAIRDILQHTPVGYPDYIQMAMSYQFLGFPLSPLNHHNYPMAEDEVRPSLKLVLAPASPNPVGSKATVAFTLPAKGAATIRVYDVGGRVVETIASDLYEAGAHTAIWEPDRKVASGQYYLKLQADGRVVTRSVSLVR